ncbi:Co-chaperone Hsc20 [Athelia psychrophila]|uniref:Co-chaperone Hsc20 n=1 Tax=Athelia psychrophila TaxID=1759441 RepID=A0A166U5P2_9AGAM|nr:Co-chaperone Hsc20 [Fibularhizoctonia sp. CBS 109695]
MTFLRAFARLRAPPAARPFSTSPRCRTGSTAAYQPLTTCPQCGKPLPTPVPVCTHCAYIARLADSTPYHALFQLPQHNPFVVDTAQLKRRYLEAQRLCHPDAWAVHGEATKAVAHSLSDLMSRAWGALKDPLPRAEYILAQHGIEIAEADQLGDLELIAEIMEVREQLEDAAPAEVEAIADANRDEIKKTCAEIEARIGAEDWLAAKTATIRLKYLEGIKKAAGEWRPDA